MMPTGFCPFTEGPPLHRLSSTSSAAFSGRTAPPAGPAPPPLRARGLRHPLLRRISEGKHGYAWAQDHLPPANQTPTRCPPPSPHAAAAPSCGQGGAGTGPSHPPTHARGPGVPAGAPAGSGQGAGRGLRVCGGWGAAAERRGARGGGGGGRATATPGAEATARPWGRAGAGERGRERGRRQTKTRPPAPGPHRRPPDTYGRQTRPCGAGGCRGRRRLGRMRRLRTAGAGRSAAHRSAALALAGGWGHALNGRAARSTVGAGAGGRCRLPPTCPPRRPSEGAQAVGGIAGASTASPVSQAPRLFCPSRLLRSSWLPLVLPSVPAPPPRSSPRLTGQLRVHGGLPEENGSVSHTPGLKVTPEVWAF